MLIRLFRSYTWDENFNLEAFKQAIDEFNKKETKNFGMHLYQSRQGAVQAARITYADNANALLDADFAVYTHSDTGKQVIRTMSYSIPAALQGHLDFVHPTIS